MGELSSSGWGGPARNVEQSYDSGMLVCPASWRNLSGR
jgi:hypothetical protein